MIILRNSGNSLMLIKFVPLGSNLSSDQNSLNLVMVASPTYRPSSSIELEKLSRIMAINKFKKMNETMSMKLMKKKVA